VSRRPVPPSPAGDATQHGNASSAPSSVRAQLLATEHWSLLATRSATQSEVLSRITTFLMLVSASIVGLALIGQVTGFDRRFIAFALVLLAMVIMVGALTQARLHNAAIEDLAYVIGMNRLRAGYVALDSSIERYLVTSAHDDDDGIWQTYNHLVGPNPAWMGLFASSTAFIMLVNSGLAGVFAALVAVGLDAPGPLVGTVAAASGLTFLGISVTLAARRRRHVQRRHVSLFPAPDSTSNGRADQDGA
jgi:hypothetical protein